MYMQTLVCLVREMGCKDAEVVECILDQMTKSSFWNVSLVQQLNTSISFLFSLFSFPLHANDQDRLQSVKLLSEIGMYVHECTCLSI